MLEEHQQTTRLHGLNSLYRNLKYNYGDLAMSTNENDTTKPDALDNFWRSFGSLIKWGVIFPALWLMSFYAFMLIFGVMDATS